MSDGITDCARWFEKSDCCKAQVSVAGITTHYYVCDECGEPCDVNESNPTDATKGV